MSKEVANASTPSQEEINQALELLRRTKEQRTKQAEKIKNNPELKAKADVRAKRLRAKDAILKQKAIAAGFVVTDEEVDTYLAQAAAQA